METLFGMIAGFAGRLPSQLPMRVGFTFIQLSRKKFAQENYLVLPTEISKLPESNEKYLKR